ncbi:MAG: T9SS type A sorting domain-containing protein [Bacteroidetes bacterium]|nr:T9SS type A sorting domain-containing protein [Bacteroidota bacterium]
MQKTILHKLLVLTLPLIFLGNISRAQCIDCGTGLDGAFSATSNTTIAGGQHNFTTFSISPGVVVRVTGSQPLEIKATGAVVIEGTLDVSGLAGADGVTYTAGGAGALGVAGGGNGGGGSFDVNNGPIAATAGTGTGAGGDGLGWSGGGGAGYAFLGGSSGGVGGIGGSIYGAPNLAGLTSGSGGGGGSGGYNCGAGGGGAGGGFVSILSCISISVSGTITANGGNGGSDGTGNCGGGGGGSGGSIWLAAPQVTNNGTLTAAGGVGGASAVSGSPYFGAGGAGSVGRIRIDSPALSGAGVVSPAVGFSGAFGVPVDISAIIATDATCFGANDGSAAATVSGGTGAVTFAWSPAGGSAATATGLAPGCYALNVTDSLGCTDTDSICITEPSPLALSVSHSDQPCNGNCVATAQVLASGGSPGYTYAWSNGDTASSIGNLCPGVFEVVVADSNGCADTATVTITEPTAIVLSETHTNASFGNNDGSGTVTASGGTPGYTYLWTPGGFTTASASSLAPGNYAVVVTDSNGCSDSILVVISELVGLQSATGIQVSLFPNPATDVVKLSVELQSESEILVQWFDLQGRLISESLSSATRSMEQAIDISGFSVGVYHCRISAEGQVLTRNLVVR